MKMLWIAVLSSVLGSSMALAGHTEFVGEFQFAEEVAEPCRSIFDSGDFRIKHFLVGSNHRTSVLYFESVEEGRENVFFDGKRFVGRLGYGDETYYEERIERNGVVYKFVIYGLVGREIMLLDFYIEAANLETNEFLCEGDIEFTGLRE